jgi:hypothetical protein
LVKVKGLGGGAVRFADSAGREQDMSEIEQGVGALVEQVGLRGERDRRACEFLRLAMMAAVSEDPG